LLLVAVSCVSGSATFEMRRVAIITVMLLVVRQLSFCSFSSIYMLTIVPVPVLCCNVCDCDDCLPQPSRRGGQRTAALLIKCLAASATSSASLIIGPSLVVIVMVAALASRASGVFGFCSCRSREVSSFDVTVDERVSKDHFRNHC
jgi:hypothetical protein